MLPSPIQRRSPWAPVIPPAELRPRSCRHPHHSGIKLGSDGNFEWRGQSEKTQAGMQLLGQGSFSAGTGGFRISVIAIFPVMKFQVQGPGTGSHCKGASVAKWLWAGRWRGARPSYRRPHCWACVGLQAMPMFIPTTFKSPKSRLYMGRASPKEAICPVGAMGAMGPPRATPAPSGSRPISPPTNRSASKVMPIFPTDEISTIQWLEHMKV